MERFTQTSKVVRAIIIYYQVLWSKHSSPLWVFETLNMGSGVVDSNDGNYMIAYTYLSFDTLQCF